MNLLTSCPHSHFSTKPSVVVGGDGGGSSGDAGGGGVEFCGGVGGGVGA